MRILGIFLAVFLLHACNQPIEESSEDLHENTTDLILPDGFYATVFVDSLGRGRHIAANKNGDIYVILRRPHNNKGIVALRDNDNDGKADTIAYFSELHGTGIHIYNDYLYVGTDESVYRIKLNPNELVPENEPELIATGFPEQNQHEVKPIAFDGEGNMYVNVGAPSNACMEQTRTPGSIGMEPCPQLEWQAGVWQFKADMPNQRQQKDGKRYVTGIRNAVALEWNEAVDELYVVQHGRDQLSQFYPDLYTTEQGANLPAEEFFLAKEGADFGWPYCYYDQFEEKKVLAPEYGGDGQTAGRCVEKEDPIMAFPGHWAPNDLIFYNGTQFPDKYKNGAFIAFHGSWNRAPLPQKGFNVVFVPFNEALPSGDYEIFADGFTRQDTVYSPGKARFRPTGLAQGHDGSVFIVDSQIGRVWKIRYEP